MDSLPSGVIKKMNSPSDFPLSLTSTGYLFNGAAKAAEAANPITMQSVNVPRRHPEKRLLMCSYLGSRDISSPGSGRRVLTACPEPG
jgi:hypothetical protein